MANNKYELLYNKLYDALDKYASLKISKKRFYSILGDNFDAYKALYSDIQKAEKFRANIIKDRELEVVFFTGKSGSGKTTAAKYFASKLNYDYFVSGSGEDILDGYDKEECIILDDFRGGVMKFSELLKFLDNNTNSSVKSRYYNKDISNCKLIIITSVQQPNELYNFMIDKDDDSMEEPIEQFYRRLKHHFYKIEDDYIWEYKLGPFIQQSNKYLGLVSDIYTELGINPDKTDDTSIFDTFTKNVRQTNNEEIF